MRYILFIKEECPYCVSAQDLLVEANKDFKTVVFTPDQQQVLNEIKTAYDWSTVPMIFCREGQDIKFIGGYTDLQRCLPDG